MTYCRLCGSGRKRTGVKAKGVTKRCIFCQGMHGERISSLETNRKTVAKAPEYLRCDRNDGFRDVRSDIKELRRQD